MSAPHHLCHLDPARPATAAIGAFPLRRSIGDPATWSAPDGMAYLPIVAAEPPVYDPETETLEGLPDAVIDGQLVTGRARIVARVTLPGAISKLTLKRRLDALGKWADFKAFLAGLGEAAVDEFNLAAEIRQDDAMFQQLAPLAKQALGLTDEQYATLLTP